MSSTKMVSLRSCDGEIFEVEIAVAQESETIKNMIEDNCADACIPLPNITSQILAKVIEYIKRHLEASKRSEDELKNFDADFVKVEQETLLNLTMAANFLNIKGLLDLLLQTVANMLVERNLDEIRKTFNIPNDFTPEEEAQNRREHPWAFQ